MADKRLIFLVPPGGRVVVGKSSVPDANSASIPLWLYWAQIAADSAKRAKSFIASDARIDALSARLAGQEVDLPEEPDAHEVREMQAMTAIAASAHAIDGFYGSVKPLVHPPLMTTRRSRQILETLKLGFQVGSRMHVWDAELDWLFNTRDSAVHHSEDFRPLRVARVTDETMVVAAAEAFDLSASSAARAASFTWNILKWCCENPKEPVRGWAQDRLHLLRQSWPIDLPSS